MLSKFSLQMLTRVLQTALQITVWEGSSIELTPFLPYNTEKNVQPWSINTPFTWKIQLKGELTVTIISTYLYHSWLKLQLLHIQPMDPFSRNDSPSHSSPSCPLVCTPDNLLVLQNSAGTHRPFVSYFEAGSSLCITLPPELRTLHPAHPPGVPVSERSFLTPLSAFPSHSQCRSHYPALFSS